MKTSHTRSNRFKIYKKYSRTSIRCFTFSQRIINDWNSLPNDVVTSPNVLTFKSKLDNFIYNQRFSLYDFIEIGFIRLCLSLTSYT